MVKLRIRGSSSEVQDVDMTSAAADAGVADAHSSDAAGSGGASGETAAGGRAAAPAGQQSDSEEEELVNLTGNVQGCCKRPYRTCKGITAVRMAVKT